MTRVLILSWEYPPLIEGGLARHVRKLSEGLARRGVEVHVLTRGSEESPAEEVVGGVNIHRVREPTRPTDLGEFVAWVERMNSDMLAAGVELGDRYDFDLVHGHDWLVAMAGDHLARRFDAPLVTTIHATEYGRHQGWVDKHPQSHIHGVERWITNRSDRVIACSYYMREQIVDIFGADESRVVVIPNGIDPDDLQPQDEPELERLRAEFAAPDEKLVLLIGRLVYEKGFQLALEAMPRLIEAVPGTRFLVAGSGTHEQELRDQADGARADGARHLPRLDRRRRPALALPDRRRLRGARRSTSRSGSSRSRRWPRAVPASSPTPAACARSSRTRRPGCASAPATRGARRDGRAPAHRRGAARPARRRGLRARPALRLGRRRRATAAVYAELAGEPSRA